MQTIKHKPREHISRGHFKYFQKNKITKSRKIVAPPVIVTDSREEEPGPEWLERGTLVELQTPLPAKLNSEREAFAHPRDCRRNVQASLGFLFQVKDRTNKLIGRVTLDDALA